LKTLKRIVAIVLIAVAIASIVPIGTFGGSAETAHAGDPKPPG